MRSEVSDRRYLRAFSTKPGKARDACRIAALFDARDGVRHVLPGAAVFIHGDRVETLYQIVSGTVRCCTILENGRRQIFTFARPGGFLGLAEIDRWHFTAEAVDHVILRTLPRDQLETKLRADPDLQSAIRHHVVQELAARERHLVTVAFMSAAERLRLFLTEFAAERKAAGFIVLPMTRQDIGDYLGLTLETVSRAFGALRRGGAIETRGADRYRMVEEPNLLAA